MERIAWRRDDWGAMAVVASWLTMGVRRSHGRFSGEVAGIPLLAESGERELRLFDDIDDAMHACELAARGMLQRALAELGGEGVDRG